MYFHFNTKEEIEEKYSSLLKEFEKYKSEQLEKLKYNESNFKSLLNAITDSIFLTDLNAKILAVNKEAARKFNTEWHELIGKCLYDFLPKDLSENRKNNIEILKQTKKPVNFQDYHNNIILDNIIYPILNTEGSVIRIAILTRDITEQRLIADKISYSESLLKNIFNTSPDAVFIVDTTSLKVIECNKKALEFFGFDNEDELKNIDIPAFQKKPPTKTELNTIIEHIENSGFWKDEVEFISKKGNEFWGQLFVTILNFRNKSYYLARIADITESKKYEAVLKDNEKKLKEVISQKDKFFSIMTHDLRAPFQALIGMSDILSNDFEKLNENKRKTFLSELNSLIRKQYKLVQNLLDWSRLHSGRFEFHPVNINLNQLCNEVILSLTGNAVSKEINVSVKFSSELVVKADFHMLYSILHNLVANAIKFTGIKGNVEIDAVEKEDCFQIMVSDSGVGIPEINIDKIFRIDSQFTTKGTAGEIGSGLGILICKELVELHNGNIWLTSSPGKGTIIYFTISKG